MHVHENARCVIKIYFIKFKNMLQSFINKYTLAFNVSTNILHFNVHDTGSFQINTIS